MEMIFVIKWLSTCVKKYSNWNCNFGF